MRCGTHYRAHIQLAHICRALRRGATASRGRQHPRHSVRRRQDARHERRSGHFASGRDINMLFIPGIISAGHAHDQ